MHKKLDKSRTVSEHIRLALLQMIPAPFRSAQMKESQGNGMIGRLQRLLALHSVCATVCLWGLEGWNDVALQYGFNETLSTAQTLSLRLQAAAVNPLLPTDTVDKILLRSPPTHKHSSLHCYFFLSFVLLAVYSLSNSNPCVSLSVGKPDQSG